MSSTAAVRPSDVLTIQRTLGNRAVSALVARQTRAIGPEGGPVSDDVAARIQQARGSGAPLDASISRQMESAFAADFSDVRVHANTESADLNGQLGAQAFTTGSDIFLGADTRPTDHDALAHELTHVVQQESMSAAGPLTVGAAGDAHEQEADHVAREVASGAKLSRLALGRGASAVARLMSTHISRLLIQREGEDNADDMDLQGTVADVEDTSPDAKTGCEPLEADSAAPPHAPGVGPTMDYRINPDVSFSGTQKQAEDLHQRSKYDSVTEALTNGSTTKRGGVVVPGDAFGVEIATYKADTISWTRDGAKKVVNLTARMFLDIGWDTHALGRTGISSDADAAVKADNYKDIVKDLKPDGTGRPDRVKFWAPDLTEKHEQFHATDDIAQAALFLPTVKAWLATQTITVPTTGTATEISAAIDTAVQDLATQAKDRVKADGWAHYGAGGEDRAYADGKSSYQGRVDAISARAVTEKWP